MNPRWQRLEEIFAEAIDIAEPARAGVLDRACAGDPGLRAEVEALLAADRRPHAILDDADALIAIRLAALRVDPAAIAVDRTICDQTLLSGGAEPARTGHHSLPLLAVAEPGGARASADDDLAVRGVLGEGGMGQVLLAWQRSLGREVAIKTIGRDAPAALADALITEARIAGALEHPVIPPIHALGRADDHRPLLVMKRIDGTAWTALLGDDAHPAWATLGTDDHLAAHLRILGRVADAVHFAHGRGYLHRDLKPDNVMIGGDDEVYLVDWGIAVPLADAAAGGELRGTPQYMAPEMVDGRPLDVRTDVFLLGATLHRVLTGAPRHRGDTLREVLASASAGTPFVYPSSVPAELAEFAAAATATDPATRPPTARAFRERLDRYLRHSAASEVAASALARAADLERRLAGAIEPGDPELQRLATEARFGLVEARRLWPDGSQIARGLARVQRLAIQLEVRRGNPAAARALLDGGDLDDPALRGAVEALERQAADRTAREARLSRLAYDLSPEVAIRALLLALLLGVAAMLGGVLVVERTGALGGTPAHVSGVYVVVGAGFLLVAAVIALVFRRALSVNLLARRQVAVAVITAGLVLVERAIAWRDGASYAQSATQEFLVIGLGTTVTAILAARIWLVVAAIGFGCAAALQMWPTQVGVISEIGLALVVVGLGAGAWRSRRRRSQDLDALATDHREDRADVP